MGAHVPQHFQGVPLRDVSQHPHAQTGACTAHQRGLPAGLHRQGPTGPSHLYPIHPIPYVLAGLVDQSHPVTAAPRPEPVQGGTSTLAVPSAHPRRKPTRAVENTQRRAGVWRERRCISWKVSTAVAQVGWWYHGWKGLHKLAGGPPK